MKLFLILLAFCGRLRGDGLSSEYGPPLKYVPGIRQPSLPGPSHAFSINIHQDGPLPVLSETFVINVPDNEVLSSPVDSSKAYEINIHHDAGSSNLGTHLLEPIHGFEHKEIGDLHNVNGGSKAYEIHEGVGVGHVLSEGSLPSTISHGFETENGGAEIHGNQINHHNSKAYEINIHDSTGESFTGSHSGILIADHGDQNIIHGGSKAYEIHEGVGVGQEFIGESLPSVSSHGFETQQGGSEIHGNQISHHNSKAYEIHEGVGVDHGFTGDGFPSVIVSHGFETENGGAEIHENQISHHNSKVYEINIHDSTGESFTGSHSGILIADHGDQNIVHGGSKAYEIHEGVGVGHEFSGEHLSSVGGVSHGFEIHEGNSIHGKNVVLNQELPVSHISTHDFSEGSEILGSVHGGQTGHNSKAYEINIHEGLNEHHSGLLSSDKNIIQQGDIIHHNSKAYEIHEGAVDHLQGFAVNEDSSKGFSTQGGIIDHISKAYEINIHNDNGAHSTGVFSSEHQISQVEHQGNSKAYEIHEGGANTHFQKEAHSSFGGSSQAFEINLHDSQSFPVAPEVTHSFSVGSELLESTGGDTIPHLSKAYEINIHEDGSINSGKSISEVENHSLTQVFGEQNSRDSSSFSVPVSDSGTFSIQYKQLHFKPSVEEKDSSFIPIARPSSEYGAPLVNIR